MIGTNRLAGTNGLAGTDGLSRPASLWDAWDALSADELRRRQTRKWSVDSPARPDAIGAWVAEMDFGTAPAVLDALDDAAARFRFGYAPPSIVRDLSEATAEWYGAQTGWAIDPDDIAPIADVIAGLELAIEHFSKPGAPVIVPTPAYMPFLFVPPALGREVIEVPMLRDEHGGFSLDLEAIDRHLAAGADLVVLANPGNPTGKVYRRDELVALGEVVDRFGARVFSDEIHAPLTLFGCRHIPFASVSEAAARAALTSISASKAWNVAGLKCAQLIVSSDTDRAVWKGLRRIESHGASTTGILANTAAYRSGGAWLSEVTAYLERNITAFDLALGETLPLARRAPIEGTYLAWVDLSAYGVGADPAAFLFDRTGVLTNSGPTFGAVGAGHVRLNLATPLPILHEIIERFGSALEPVG
jgi:cystathionine beta-lyase